MTSQIWAGSDLQFKQISLEAGLSQSTVSCMYQDYLGYLWIGTFDGLNRYDGYSFVQYKFNPNEPSSLSNNRILAIFEDRDFNLWVGTDGGGLNRFNRNPGSFTKYVNEKENLNSLSDNRVRAIAEDSAGRVWIGTGGGGLDRYDPASDQFTVYRRTGQKTSLSHNRVRVLFTDSSGRLWIGTGGGGLDLYVPELDQFEHFIHDEQNPRSLPDDQVNAIIEGDDGDLWIGTYSGGLSRFNPKTGEFFAYQHNDDFHSIISNMVNALHKDDFGQIWVATDQGLDRFDPVSQTFTHFHSDPESAGALSDSEICTLFQDRSGVLWVGTRNGGLNQLERGKQTFVLYRQEPENPGGLSDNRISALYQSKNGNLWVGTNGSGLDLLGPNDSSFSHFAHQPQNPNSLSDNRVSVIRQDSKNNLWVGTGNGLNRMDLDHPSEFERFLNQPSVPDSLGDNQVWSLLVDHEEQLWVGTEFGLDRLKPDGKSFEHYRQDDSSPGGLSHNVIWCLAQDQSHRFWIGTENGGLNRMDKPGEFVAFTHDDHDPSSLSNNTILSLCVDGTTLWIGTWGGGLNALNLNGEPEFTHFREKDGLPNDIVYGILSDGRGNLWISTNQGLAFFNPQTRAFRAYASKDGLQGQEFNPGAYWRGNQGEMFFGGDGGFNAFHPDNFRENVVPPELVITAFRNHDDLVAQDLSNEASFTLEPHQNYLSFEFVALDYNNPEQNRYAYYLEGAEQEWFTGKHRLARYSALKPGNYTFRVKASNNDNVWNEPGLAVKIRIKAPFFQTTWFFVLCGLVLAGLIGLVLLFQSHQIRQEEAKKLVALELRSKTDELEEARLLQLSMLPRHLPKHPNLKMAVAMETASEVGGDYYDFHVGESGTLTLAFGDATGHGLKAGTMVAAAKGMFLTLVPNHKPVNLLIQASRAMRLMRFKKMFMAMGIAEFEHRRMTLAMAGMPAVSIFHAVDKRLELIPLKGLPLGGIPFPYEAKTFDLEPGDLVFFQSDGLEEMFNPANKMFGANRVRSAFAVFAHLEPEAIIKALLDEGKKWAEGRPQEDDVTLIIIKII